MRLNEIIGVTGLTILFVVYIGINIKIESPRVKISTLSGPIRSPNLPKRGALISAAIPGTEAITPLIKARLLTEPVNSRI